MKNPFIFFKPVKSIEAELRDLKSKPADYWEKKGKKKVLELYTFVHSTVPAYKKFLKHHGVKGNNVNSIESFQNLPAVDKKTYLRASEYSELFPKNKFYSATTYSATSGSTGEPFYFPRGEEQDAEYQYMAEIFLKDQFEIGKKRTLGIMGFALGVWIGGIFTYKALNKVSTNGYDFTLIPTGTNKDQFLSALKKFGHLYDQVILMGYPPFIKDVLDSAHDAGVKLEDYSLKILTAAEGFSEKFRDYIAEKAGLKNPLRDVVNMYGTVELGTMAHETQFANLIRNIASKNQEFFKAIFPNATNMPTLAQYYPHLHYFEEVNGELIVSGYGSLIPLIRYKTSDLGGVITFDTMLDKIKSAGINIKEEMRRHKISPKMLKLPFVYLYTRSDFAVVFRGANIYPEEVRGAIDDKILSDFVTGKFTIIRKEDDKMDQVLEINIELKNGVVKSDQIQKMILNHLVDCLRKNNSEFNNEFISDPKKACPSIVLWDYQDQLYFGGGRKQKWVGESK